MTAFELEIGKLMAQFDSLQQRLDDVRKGMDNANKQLMKWHQEFENFAGDIMEKMEKRFILRSEIAPIKAMLSVIAVATVSAICLTLSELFFKRLF